MINQNGKGDNMARNVDSIISDVLSKFGFVFKFNINMEKNIAEIELSVPVEGENRDWFIGSKMELKNW
jgi:hypothetical protein